MEFQNYFHFLLFKIDLLKQLLHINANKDKFKFLLTTNVNQDTLNKN